MVSLCMAILGPLLVILILLTIIDALVYLGSVDYRSILVSIEEAVAESGTSSSPARDWLSSRLAEIQRRIRSRSPESRQGDGQASHPQSTSRQ